MRRVRLAVKAFLAGTMISIGGTLYINLVESNKVAGAILFAVGLVTICAFGLSLFTGMAGYLLEGKVGRNAVDLLTVWCGNFIGCAATGFALRAALRGSEFLAQAQSVAAGKLEVSPLQALVTGALCGVLMYVAVDNYRNSAHEVGKYLGIMLCVPAFILAGFEHSVADMYFLAVGLGGGIFSGDAALVLVLVTVGNLTGSVLFAALRKFGTKQ